MKKMVLVCLLILVAGSSALADPITNFPFTADNEGWQNFHYGPQPGQNEEDPILEPDSWQATGGDPAGHLRQTVGTDRNHRADSFRYYGAAAFMGDLNNLLVQANVFTTGDWITVSGDIGPSGQDDGNVYARLYIGSYYGYYISRQSVSLDMNSFNGWGDLIVEMVAENFVPYYYPNSSFETIASEYVELGYVIFSGTDDAEDINGSNMFYYDQDANVSRAQHRGANAVSGNATWGIDNVTVGENTVPVTSVYLDQIKSLYR